MTRIVGRGWATVELDRAADELADLLTPGSGFVDAPRSVILGATCRVARAGIDDEAGVDWIVLLEPDTEGALAEYLARSGEGWAATWELPLDEASAGQGVPGPLGSERLMGRGPAGDPFRLLLTAATIE